jgi:hypothetical protein
MEMQRLMMIVMMSWAPTKCVAARMMPSASSSLQIPSKGGVSTSCGSSECRISDLSSCGECIWQAGGGSTLYMCAVRVGLLVPPVVKPSGVASRVTLSPRCVENPLNDFITSKYHIYVQYDNSKWYVHHTFIIWDFVETSIKSVRERRKILKSYHYTCKNIR